MTTNDLKPWAHRRSAKIFCESIPDSRGQEVLVFYRFVRGSRDMVDEICRGERYAHVSPGLIFNYENYRGSVIDDWHGGPTGSLTELLRWVAEAKRPEYAATLWMLP